MKPRGCMESIGPFGSSRVLRVVVVLSGGTEEMGREELSRDVFGVGFSAGIWRGGCVTIQR